MVNSNEQALLTSLEEWRTTTQSSLTNEKRTLWYWASNEHQECSGVLTNHQIDFFIENAENRIGQLKFRLEWLDTQIGNLQALISLTQPNK